MPNASSSERDRPSAPPQGFSPHSVRLAWILALAYLLVIAYASLQPLRGWRFPPEEVLRFLAAPWPRYITLHDVAVNIAAYVPLGFLLSVGCGARLGAGRGALLASAAAALFSSAMETVQMFLPARIASNVDLLANALGALIGALAAPLFAPARLLGGKLHALRHRLFREGMAADTGLVIVCLWPLTQFHPTVQLFGTGAIRATFDLPAAAAHTPLLAFSGEAAVALFSLLGVGLMLATLARENVRPLAAIGALLAVALAIKTVASVWLAQSSPLAWLTPGVALALLAGGGLLGLALLMPRRALPAAAAAAIVLATAAINLAPDNPYHSVPPLLLAGIPSHVLSFTGIVRALSELWPLLALGWLAAARSMRGTGGPHAAERTGCI
jgi:VanZ family protein